MNQNTAGESCPYCQSLDTVFKSRAREWECNACERRFPANKVGTAGKISYIEDRAIDPKVIFFSYGHDSNRDLVDLLRHDLEKRGHTVWIDYKEIGVWDDWRGRITQGIHDSQIALAFLSRHSVRDPGVCRNEISIALHHFGAVYPLLIEALEPKDIPVTIANLQWPDLSRWRDIQAGIVQGEDFARWYQERLREIVSKIENDCSRFANETGVLGKVLEATSFDAKFSQYLDGFDGRKWVFDAFDHWLNGQPESRVFWLKAGPGFGKTSLAVQFASRYRGSVVASWFCDHQSIELKDPRQLLMGLAFQISNRWADYRARLLPRLDIRAGSGDAIIQAAHDALRKKSLPDLFRHLFLEPMTGLIWHENKFVVLIDALDEATSAEGINELAALIGSYFLALPSWLGFVFTSRPDQAVIQHLQGFKPFEVTGDDGRNLADLGQYLDAAIMSLPVLRTQSAAQTKRIRAELLRKSCGMVLYLRMVLEGLREGRLNVTNLADLESGVPGLYSRYSQEFSSRFGVVQLEHALKQLLRLVVVAPGPLPLEVASQVLGWSREEVVRVRGLAGSYLVDSPAGLTLFHKTLAEWLTAENSGVWYCDIESGVSALTGYLLEIYLPNGEVQGESIRPRAITGSAFKDLLAWLPVLVPKTGYWFDDGAVRCLADIFDSKSRYWDAVSFHERSFKLADRSIHIQSPDRAFRAYRYGRALARVARYGEAESMLRLSVQLVDLTGRSKALWVGDATEDLAFVVKEQVRFAEAEGFYREALDFWALLGSAQDPERVIQGHSSLGELLDARGLFKEAGAVYENAMKIVDSATGPLSEKGVAFLNNFALYRMRMDGSLIHGPSVPRPRIPVNTNSVISILNKALKACQIAGVARSRPAVPLLLTTLGVYLLGLRDDTASKIVLSNAVQCAEAVFGSQHRIMATCLNNLAAADVCIAENAKSNEDNFERVIEIYSQTYGLRHPHVARVLNNAGAHAHCKGDNTLARQNYLSAIEILSATLGESHCDTAQVRSNLALLEALTLANTDQLDSLKGVLKIRQSALGEYHPQTCASRIHYGIVANIKNPEKWAQKSLNIGLRSLESWIQEPNKFELIYESVMTRVGLVDPLVNNKSELFAKSSKASGDSDRNVDKSIATLMRSAAALTESVMDAPQNASSMEWVSAWGWRDQLILIDVGFKYMACGW